MVDFEMRARVEVGQRLRGIINEKWCRANENMLFSTMQKSNFGHLVASARHNILDTIDAHALNHVLYFYNLSLNPTMRINFVLENPDCAWEWSDLSSNPGITLDDINRHLNLPWSWSHISENPNIRIQFVLDHMDKPLSWFNISKNSGIRLKDIRARPDLPWCWAALSRNPNMRFAFVLQHLDMPWCWKSLSINAGITMADIETYPCLPWSWRSLSNNPNISLQFVQTHLYRPWRWDYAQLSANKGLQASEVFSHSLFCNLDPKILAKNVCMAIADIKHTSCNASMFRDNPFINERKQLVAKYAREHMAAYKIQQKWRSVVIDPSHDLCCRIQFHRIKFL